MKIRQMLEEREKLILCNYATLSINTKGRKKNEEQCDIRPCFQRDRDRILHSKAFRRLKNKTQVFLTPQGDHYRTRMSHTLEVAQNARTIAKALLLNEDLAEAIALGHDLGHTPYGHAGELVLNELCEGGFVHSDQSVRIVEFLEKDGKGLNLTWEVIDGIKNHQSSHMPHTPEGCIVRLSDKIAYVYHDFDDAIRAGIMTEEDVPRHIIDVLGATPTDRLDTLIHDVISSSKKNMDLLDEDQTLDIPVITMSSEVEKAMFELREFMFEHLYTNPIAKSEELKAQRMLRELYNYYISHIEELPELYRGFIKEGHPKDRIVCDYIAGMTDQFAVYKFREMYTPLPWQSF